MSLRVKDQCNGWSNFGISLRLWAWTLASVTVMSRDHALSSFLSLFQQADRKCGLHQVLVKRPEHLYVMHYWGFKSVIFFALSSPNVPYWCQTKLVQNWPLLSRWQLRDSLANFCPRKKIFLQLLGLEKLQLGDCSIGITPQLHFYRNRNLQKRKCVQGLKSLVTNQTGGYHLRTFATQTKEQRRALTESATESVLPASPAAHSTGFKPFLLASKFRN